ncbi:MAG: MmcQ/YjbR family DNA-binding protein [Bacteroidetes bacterium]|nr:MmcQ/YjbR family DNA-binding protein [Bacteroidota bacterium]
MHIEELREYCLSKPGTTEDFPFDSEVLVFRVLGKIFLLTPVSAQPPQFNAKCDPERAVELRGRYDSIKPGYHMNKQHWNTVVADGSVPKKLLLELIDHSYELIRNSLPKKQRDTLQ